MSKEQSLVNAQIDVNRAMFTMNQKHDMTEEELKKWDNSKYLLQCIDSAIQNLTDAREGYCNQLNLKFE